MIIHTTSIARPELNRFIRFPDALVALAATAEERFPGVRVATATRYALVARQYDEAGWVA